MLRMNCPSRTDETLEHPGWNQNPSPLNPDITTRSDFNGRANSKVHRRHAAGTGSAASTGLLVGQDSDTSSSETVNAGGGALSGSCPEKQPETDSSSSSRRSGHPFKKEVLFPHLQRIGHRAAKFARFVGPGFLVAVAYIDPGNYSTDVAAGAQYRYALLFTVLVSNLFAIFLQALCVKLGTVTGLNLAENCREHFPRWVVIVLYVFAEAAIVATDIAEVSSPGLYYN